MEEKILTRHSKGNQMTLKHEQMSISLIRQVYCKTTLRYHFTFLISEDHCCQGNRESLPLLVEM